MNSTEFAHELSKVTPIPKVGMVGNEGLNNLLNILFDFNQYKMVKDGQETDIYDRETILFLYHNLETLNNRHKAVAFFYETFQAANDIYLGRTKSKLEPYTLQSLSKFLQIALSDKFQDSLKEVQ